MDKKIMIEVKTKICDVCDGDLETYNGHPYVSKDGKDYCPDCAYKKGIISKREWAECHGIILDVKELKCLEVV